MSARSLNKVMLIGNLTRDPELRYTPQGTAVCTMGMATNRTWVTDSGEKREETEFHRIVAWNKLAELCANMLFKGRKIYIEGRLQTRQWTGQDGNARQATEVVIEDMLILDSRRQGEEGQAQYDNGNMATPVVEQPVVVPAVVPEVEQPVEEKKTVKKTKSELVADDIPF